MADEHDHSRTRLLFAKSELAYDFGAEHPLQPGRLVALMDLLETSGLWIEHDEQRPIPLRAATIEELSLVHTADYLTAVHRLSASAVIACEKELAFCDGLDAASTPARSCT